MPDFITTALVIPKTVNQADAIQLTCDKIAGVVAQNAAVNDSLIYFDKFGSYVFVGAEKILIAGDATQYTVSAPDMTLKKFTITPLLQKQAVSGASMQIVQALDQTVFDQIANAVEEEIYARARIRYAVPFPTPASPPDPISDWGAQGWKLFAYKRRGNITEDHADLKQWRNQLQQLALGQVGLDMSSGAGFVKLDQISLTDYRDARQYMGGTLDLTKTL